MSTANSNSTTSPARRGFLPVGIFIFALLASILNIALGSTTRDDGFIYSMTWFNILMMTILISREVRLLKDDRHQRTDG